MNRTAAREYAARRCWANIGNLGGDRSCPKLLEVGSCRECEVIAVAADDLLAREPTAAPALEAGRAAPLGPLAPSAAAEGHDRLTLVTFMLGDQALAVDVTRLVEVGAPRPVRRVPHRTRGAFLGLVNVQGRLEPCFSLSHVLGLEPIPEAAERRLVVVGDARHRCAFFAQKVALKDADQGAVGEPPATITAALDTHVRGILRLAGQSCAWLDVDRLINTLERSLT